MENGARPSKKKYNWRGISMKKILGSTFLLFILSLISNNLTFAEETSVLSGIPIQGKITSMETIDVYRFTTTKDGGEVYITLDEATGGFSMNLYDENENYVEGDYFSTKGNKIVINENLQQGTYFIKIKPYRWDGITSASYRLKATYASSFERNSKTFEPNDTVETVYLSNLEIFINQKAKLKSIKMFINLQLVRMEKYLLP